MHLYVGDFTHCMRKALVGPNPCFFSEGSLPRSIADSSGSTRSQGAGLECIYVHIYTYIYIQKIHIIFRIRINIYRYIVCICFLCNPHLLLKGKSLDDIYIMPWWGPTPIYLLLSWQEACHAAPQKSEEALEPMEQDWNGQGHGRVVVSRQADGKALFREDFQKTPEDRKKINVEGLECTSIKDTYWIYLLCIYIYI